MPLITRPLMYLRLIAVLTFVLSFGAVSALAQDRATGLTFADPSAYQSVPVAQLPFSGSELPTRVDMSGSLPQPGNQGDQNSCVGWTVAYALKSYQEQQEESWPLGQGGAVVDAHVFSPSFIYNQINQGKDKGAVFTDAFDVLSNVGAAPLSAMPHAAHDAPVPEAAKRTAARYRIQGWRRVNQHDTREVKAQLNADLPVVIGAMIDDGFGQQRAGEVWSAGAGQSMGGHAMLVVGYDDAKQAFKVMNSWGGAWGSAGYGWIDYTHFKRVVREAYIVRDAKNGPDAAPPMVVVDTQAPEQTAPYVPPVIQQAPPQIAVNNFMHNQMDPNFGPGVRITGFISIPGNPVGTANVAVQISFANGTPVGAGAPQFAMPDGQAATGTGPLYLNGNPVVNLPWYAFLPYCSLNIAKGQMCLPYPQGPPITTQLLAKSVLFIDAFGVAETQNVPFTLTL